MKVEWAKKNRTWCGARAASGRERGDHIVFHVFIIRFFHLSCNSLSLPGFSVIRSEPFCKRVPTPPKTSYKVHCKKILGTRIRAGSPSLLYQKPSAGHLQPTLLTSTNTLMSVGYRQRTPTGIAHYFSQEWISEGCISTKRINKKEESHEKGIQVYRRFYR
jgi:hypothetical protein